MNIDPSISLLFLAQAANTSTNAPARGIGDMLTREEIFKLATEVGPRAFGAMICLLVGFAIAVWFGRLLWNFLSRREVDPPLRLLFVRLAKLVVIVVSIMLALQQLGFQLLPLIAGLGVAGVGVGLAMQGVLSNLVAGLTIIFVRKFRIGEYIEINDVHGRVDMIELFSTTLIMPDRSRVIIPNRKIVGEIIHNYGKIRQADLSVGVAYGTDLARALEVVRQVLASNPRVLKEPVPIVAAGGFGDSSVNITVRPWAELADFLPMQSEVNQAIHDRFREAGISIPFPQREIRILPGSEVKSAA